jgi:hypothetical protein
MENAVLVQANTGKIIVIMNSKEYAKKVRTFLTDNNFHLLQKDPTIKYQKLIQKTLQQCNLLINKKKINYLIQTKPLPPTLKAQLKLHKPDIPNRPVINNMKVPTYKVAKHTVKLLNRHLTLKTSIQC